jgi:hypothetical protein
MTALGTTIDGIHLDPGILTLEHTRIPTGLLLMRNYSALFWFSVAQTICSGLFI